MQDINEFYIQKLTQRLVMLMALIKQTKPAKHMAPLCFQIYNKELKLCVVTHLAEYLKRTKSYGDTDKLFLTCIKPYRAASKDTISRWCKSIIKESGISIHSYTSHSSRAAASLYAKTRGALLSTVIQSTGWKSERTYARLYEKQQRS